MTDFRSRYGGVFTIESFRSKERGASISFEATQSNGTRMGMLFDAKQIPSMMLSLAEAAGVEPFQEDTDWEAGTDNHLRRIAYELELYGGIKRANEKLAKLDKRRNELAIDFSSNPTATYYGRPEGLRRAIDYIVELENQTP